MIRIPTLALLCAAALLMSSPMATLAAPAGPAAATAAPAGAKPAKRVDINSASLAELKTLPGIGDAEAQRIIAARPYPSKAKLVADKVLPEATYRALQGLIVAVPPAPARAKP